MIANYHTHTYRCHHATGFEWQYVQKALEGGFCILGFADHIPNPFEQFSHPGVRMRCRQLPEYMKTIRQLKAQFQQELTIHCGLEAEYHPKRFAKQLELIRQAGGADYLLLGQHLYFDEQGKMRPADQPFTAERDLANYVDLVIEGMNTGQFLYLCHPDLPRFEGEEEIYKKQMRRLCKEAKRLALPLEINGQGLRTKRIYPRPLFWSLAAEEGNTCVIGTDAHTPDAVCNLEEVAMLEAFAARFALPILETLEERL